MSLNRATAVFMPGRHQSISFFSYLFIREASEDYTDVDKPVHRSVDSSLPYNLDPLFTPDNLGSESGLFRKRTREKLLETVS